MLAVPPALLDVLRLGPGVEVGIAVESGRLVVDRHPRRRYTIEELLAQCDPKAARSSADGKWLRGKPVGRELSDETR